MIKIRHLVVAFAALASLYTTLLRVADAYEETAELEAFCAAPGQKNHQAKAGCAHLASATY